VLDDLSSKPSLNDLSDFLITRCEKYELFADLLAEIQEINPRQYERHAPHLHDWAAPPDVDPTRQTGLSTGRWEDPPERKPQESVSIHLDQTSITAGRDVQIKGVESHTVTIGDVGASTAADSADDPILVLIQWQAEIEAEIDAQPTLSADDKADLKEQVAKIQKEAAKGAKADPSRLEWLINILSVMASDIFEVAIETLVNPLRGIGLVLKKIGGRAKVERETGGA
jgi:hypothetical protein